MKDEQSREKARLEEHYADIEKMAKENMEVLKKQYNNDFNAIANDVEARLTKTQNYLKTLTTLKLNFSDKDIEDAIESGDVSGYLTKHKDAIDQATKVDADGLENILNNLTNTNKKTDMEQDDHYRNLLSKQKLAQNNELDSSKLFGNTSVDITDAFLELVESVYTTRFTNITTIAETSMQKVLEALKTCESAFAELANLEGSLVNGKFVRNKLYKEMWKSNGSSSSYDTSDALYNSTVASTYISSISPTAGALTIGLGGLVSTIGSLFNSNNTSNSIVVLAVVQVQVVIVYILIMLL